MTTIRRFRNISHHIIAAVLATALALNAFAMPSYENAFRGFYEEGRYEDAVSVLENHLDLRPDDYKARMKLTVTLLRIDEREFAGTHIDWLRSAGSEESARYARTLEQLVERMELQARHRELIAAALENLDASTARGLVNDMDLSAQQKAIVSMYVEVYAADFDAARVHLTAFKPQRFAEHKKVEELRAEIDFAEIRYHELINLIDSTYYSGSSVSTHGKQWAEKVPAIQNASLEGYFNAVSELAALTPMDPRAMDAMFHAAILGADYEALNGIGGRVLAAKGSIRIPFFCRNAYFDLVLDSRSGALRTERQQRPFRVTYTKKGTNQPENRWYQELNPFNLPLREINALEQKVTHNYTTQGMAKQSFALKINGTGVAPNYALMPALHMLYGEKVQKRATKNLGQFIASRARQAGATVNAKLVDPEKVSPEKKAIALAIFAGVASAAGTAASVDGNIAAADSLQNMADMMQDQVTEMLLTSEETALEHQAWSNRLAARGLEFAEEIEFAQVETLLEIE